jgi:CIC family chloride channel protein
MWQPAMGGLAIGLLLLGAPQIMGVGYEYVDQALNGGLLLKTLLLLCVLKIVATIVSYASGNAGGIFAPTLYIGAMAGGAVGMVVHRFAPFPTGDPGAYALVGMGALFAGIIRAPMTSVFMIFEITQDYQILVPLMVANLLSFMLARRYQPIPVYHALLQQDHIHLPAVETRPAATTVTARELMGPDTSYFLSGDLPIAEAWQRAQVERTPAYLVGTPEQLLGLVTRARLSDAAENGRDGKTMASLVEGDAVHAHPDHPIDVVLERLARSDGVLPIVSREHAQRVEGIVTLDRLMRAMSSMRTASASREREGLLSAKGTS